MEVLRSPTSKMNQTSCPQEGQKNPELNHDSRSQEKCSRCDAFLAQLNKMIRSCAGKGAQMQEEEGHVLTYLHRLQELLKGLSQYRGSDAQVIRTRSPQGDSESLKQQHQLVTEQLKGLFKQRRQQQQQLSGQQKQLTEFKAESFAEQWARKSREVQDVTRAIRPPGKPHQELQGGEQHFQEALASPTGTGEAHNLQQQLQEKTEMISAMASEIKALQQKNESLMKAKLRFQQQIQEIRNFPQRPREWRSSEMVVPRLSSRQDLGLSQQSGSSAPSPSGNDTVSSTLHSREDLYLVKQGPLLDAEDEQSSFHPDGNGHQLQTRPNLQMLEGSIFETPPPSQLTLPTPTKASGKPHLHVTASLPIPWSKTDSEGSLLTPRGSALLSPRPYHPRRPGSPFKFRGSLEPPGD